MINDFVYLTNVRYQNKQNKTKVLFFDSLVKGKSTEEFTKDINKIWNNIDHRFMDQQIKKLQKVVNKDNINEAINIGRMDKRNPIFKETEYWVIDSEYFKLTPESYFKEFEQKYKRGVINNYQQTLNNIDKGYWDKETILDRKLDSYDRQVNQVITYFKKDGSVARKVNLSTYLSMIHNVNLTRGAWNQTMSDANYLGKNEFIIPWHPFSCPICLEEQNHKLSREDVEGMLDDTYNPGVEDLLNGSVSSVSGNILHPNCKCTLDIYWSATQIQREVYSIEEQEDFYKVRQKVNALTLEKSRLRASMKSAELIGNTGEYDKLHQKVLAINRNIREQKKLVPEELRKQLVAINR